MIIEIDKGSGFCFGVVHAIDVAERELAEDPELYCLGDIVHNQLEVDRLRKMGMTIITHDDLDNLAGKKVLFRAHGEPPETYQKALKNNLRVIDATCPVVLKLQTKIHNSSLKMNEDNGQVVIFGKQNHPEVTGLYGQTAANGIVISSKADIEKIDFSRPVSLFVQTTKGVDEFNDIREEILQRIRLAGGDTDSLFTVTDSICRQMANRVPALLEFAARFDIVIFVSGKKSSNGHFLFEKCHSRNPNTKFISDKSELQKSWFINAESVGICGATSTPMWLMEDIAKSIKTMEN